MRKIRLRLQQIAAKPSDQKQIAMLCRDLGHSFPDVHLKTLRAFRSEVAATRDLLMANSDPEEAFAKGVLYALTEVAAAYDGEMQARYDSEGLERLLARRVDNAVLEEIGRRGVAVPSDLADATKQHPSQVSRALANLRRHGLVELAESNEAADQRRRAHRITAQGRLQLTNVQD